MNHRWLGGTLTNFRTMKVGIDRLRSLDQMDEDVAADIVQDLEPEQQEAVVSLLEEREEIKELLSYPEGTAGALMTTDFVVLPASVTAQRAIEIIGSFGNLLLPIEIVLLTL